jgi:GTP-binding protein
MGRSNVGKSSFINHVFANKALARVSKKPGKTTLANFFKVNDGTVWVDLPGYGHAKRAKTEQVRWSRLIADYCEKRENLLGVIWLCDSRHPGLDIDKEACAWFQTLSMPVFMVLTKADKLTRNEQAITKKQYRQHFNLNQDPLVYSNTADTFRDEFFELYSAWQKDIVREHR